MTPRHTPERDATAEAARENLIRAAYRWVLADPVRALAIAAFLLTGSHDYFGIGRQPELTQAEVWSIASKAAQAEATPLATRLDALNQRINDLRDDLKDDRTQSGDVADAAHP